MTRRRAAWATRPARQMVALVLLVLAVGVAICVCAGWLSAAARSSSAPSSPARGGGGGGGASALVFRGAGGKLQYKPDEQGNVIPDFSNCGYRGGGVRLPDAPVKAQLAPDAKSKDDTARIQAAIDQVSKLPVGSGGLRGAVLLKRGKYRVGDTLNIEASGIVLRGEGDGESGTILVATAKDRYDLIDIDGKDELREEESSRQPVTDRYVPVGARSFSIVDASGFKVGDAVIVRRTGNADWIRFIAMDRITPRPTNPSSTRQWQPFELRFDRVITAIEGKRITIDAPITCAIEAKWGGGSVTKYSDPGRIENVGVEQLRAVAEYNPDETREHNGKRYAADEDHANYLVSFENVKNAWGRGLTTVHFGHGPAAIRSDAKWVTVQDCRSLEPVSVITGGRRYPYLMAGQLSMYLRCYSRGARHAFVVQSRVCGPNVFLDCVSEEDYATSEPHHRWSVGGLYDNVKAPLAIQDRQYMGSGHGWAGANYVVWNCQGTLVCQRPPTAQNWAIGFVGKREAGAFDRPPGHWESFGKHVQPRSLYLQQLEDRLGAQAVKAVMLRKAAP